MLINVNHKCIFLSFGGNITKLCKKVNKTITYFCEELNSGGTKMKCVDKSNPTKKSSIPCLEFIVAENVVLLLKHEPGHSHCTLNTTLTPLGNDWPEGMWVQSPN